MFRFFGITSLITGFFTIWFLGWFLVSLHLEGRLSDYLDRPDIDITCSNSDIVGFPFRFGLSCSDFAVRDESRDIFLTTGSLRTAAQFYDLTEHIIEISGPFLFTSPDLTLASSSPLRSYIDFSDGDLVLVSTTFSSLDGILDGATDFHISEGIFHVRPSPSSPTQDLDIALTATSSSFDFLGDRLTSDIFLDFTGYDFYARLLRGATLTDLLSSAFELDLRALVINPTDYASIFGFSGLIDVNRAGYLSGHINVGIESGADFLGRVGADSRLTPVVSLIEQVGALARPRVFGDRTLPSTKIKFDDGNARFGFFDIGRLPPLPPPFR